MPSRSRSIGPRLARFEHPRHVAFVDELPPNMMGTLQKNALRETYKAVFAPAA